MRGVSTAVLSLAIFLSCPSLSKAYKLCPKENWQNGSLYLLNGCWSEVEQKGLFEGDLQVAAATVPKFTRRFPAQFLYIISQPPSYRSAVVIKERVYRPSSIFGNDGKLQAAGDRVSDVVLRRTAIQSVCDQKDDLDNIARRLNRSQVTVNVNVYNRYHAQQYDFIPITRELSEFHFKYPTGPNCLESVREHQAGLQSFRSMRRIEARRKNASALRLRFSQSLASLRQRLSQAMVRSTIQRRGSTTNPFA